MRILVAEVPISCAELCMIVDVSPGKVKSVSPDSEGPNVGSASCKGDGEFLAGRVYPREYPLAIK